MPLRRPVPNSTRKTPEGAEVELSYRGRRRLRQTDSEVEAESDVEPVAGAADADMHVQSRDS